MCTLYHLCSISKGNIVAPVAASAPDTVLYFSWGRDLTPLPLLSAPAGIAKRPFSLQDLRVSKKVGGGTAMMKWRCRLQGNVGLLSSSKQETGLLQPLLSIRHCL